MVTHVLDMFGGERDNLVVVAHESFWLVDTDGIMEALTRARKRLFVLTSSR